VMLDALDHRLGPKAVGYQRQYSAALGFLRLRQRGKVVPLIRHHLREADTHRPDWRHQRSGGLPGPAVCGPENLPDSLLSLVIR